LPTGRDQGRIALIGDLHGFWDDLDVHYFNNSAYDLLLFTGDLGSGTQAAGVDVARSLARLAKPVVIIPGNNDVNYQPLIAAELAHQRGLIRLLKAGPKERSRELGVSSGKVELGGYSLHLLELGGRSLTLVVGRPHSMGGSDLSFGEHLERNHGVASMAASHERLCKLVESAATDDLLVLSHNGPRGLGDQPTDLWGCDFRDDGGDWGDPDLAAALAHAKRVGKRVLAVIAGHMHHRTRSGEERAWRIERDGILYLNPAKVPRVYTTSVGMVHYHVRLEVGANGVEASEVLVGTES